MTRPLSRGTRPLWSTLAGTALMLAVSAGAQAQTDYPNRTLRVVVPFPAGAGADSNARLISQKLAESLKQTVVVENRPGANGILGTDAVAKASPDGYTLLFVDRGALGINPSLYKQLPYDPLKDLAYVGIAVWGPYVVVAKKDLDAKTFADFTALAKQQPKKLNYASFGNGSMTQMGTESLSAFQGIELTHIPYKGGAPALGAAMSGEVDIAMVTIGSALGAIKDGRVKPLLVGGTQRSALLPDVPSVSEIGGNADTIPNTYFGFAVPAATPPAIIKQLSTAIQQVIAQPDVRQRMIANGFEPANGSPEEMAEVVSRDIRSFGELARKLGIQPE